MFRNKIHVRFQGEELLAPRPTSKLEGHPLSTVRDCFFDIFAATVNIGGCSSIRNLRTRHTVVTGTHLSHGRLFSYESRSRDYHTFKCNTSMTINVHSLTDVRAARRRWQSEWALSTNPFVSIFFPPNLGCFYLRSATIQFPEWSCKAKFAYLCTSGCCCFRNTLLVKLCTSWDDGATDGNSLENRFPEYQAVTFSRYVGCQ
jgi:hypothetical protein